MAYLFLYLPLLTAVLAALMPSNRLRPWFLPVAGVCHFIMTCLTLAHPAWWTTSAGLALDPPGRLVLLVVSTLYLACSFYAVGFLRKLPEERSNRVFCICMLAFPGLAGLATWSQHLGLMWVAIEGTTPVVPVAGRFYELRARLLISAQDVDESPVLSDVCVTRAM